MTPEPDLIKTAEFNPSIKRYILLLVAFILTMTLFGIPFLIVWFVGPGQYISRRYYENLKCKLTVRHLVFSKGVIFKVEKTIPLENIQDLTFIENPLLKLLDLRILKVETAGHSNPQGSDMKLVGIINSADFKEEVLQQRELLRTEFRTENKQAASNNKQILDILKEMKNLLKDIKNK